MSLRIVITRAAPEGSTPETIEVEWENQDLAPDGAHIVAIVNSLIAASPDALKPAAALTRPEIAEELTEYLAGEAMAAGDLAEVRAMGQRVIWLRSAEGIPAGTVSENLEPGDRVVDDRGGAGRIPVWRKRR
jgi:hypothetical protein